MKNKQYYQETFDEVRAPEALQRKVMDMKENQTGMKKKRTMRYAVAFAAVFAFCMVVSNGICYAATGETWVGKVTMMINGKPMESEVTFHKEGDMIVGETSFDVDDDSGEMSVALTDDASGKAVDNLGTSYSTEIEADGDAGIERAALVENTSRIYLVLGSDVQIDITDDFADGEAAGVFEQDGKKYQYKVTGTLKEPKINVSCDD